jgi:hypothetical protein
MDMTLRIMTDANGRRYETYDHPIKRKWINLTNEEVQTIWKNSIGWGDPSHDEENLVRAIESKLKEKNT